MMHEDGEREKIEIQIWLSGGLTVSIQIRPSGGLTVFIQIRPSRGLYRHLYPDLAGRRGVKVLAGREFSIPPGLWGVLAAGGQGS
jgi:hypothetical protein